MSFVDRILAPVDFSASSQQSASYAGVLAERLAAELTLLHVAEPLTFGYSMVGPSQALLKEMTETRLKQRREQLDALGIEGTVTRRELAHGDAAEEILKCARQIQSGLIVLATRGTNPIQRVLGLGSVTLQVLGGADCPVLTGTHFAEPPQLDAGRILCALDFDGVAAPLKWAQQAAREFGARLTLVHAISFAEKREMVDGDWIKTIRERVADRFSDVLRAHAVDADLIIEDGRPREVVAAAARSTHASLVVIGRSSAHDTMGRLRANSFDIIRRSPCPVVSV